MLTAFFRSRRKFARPMDTGLSLMRFFRLRIRSCPAEKRTASSGEIPVAIFTGLRTETDTMNQQTRTVRSTDNP